VRILSVYRQSMGQSQSIESLEIALAAASLALTVHLLFLDDAVFQLVNERQDSLTALLGALSIYDIEVIYVDAVALRQRQLTVDDLCLSVHAVMPDAIAALLPQYDWVVS
jgi:tRNA 2-thiouridine synthesizing protein C